MVQQAFNDDSVHVVDVSLDLKASAAATLRIAAEKPE